MKAEKLLEDVAVDIDNEHYRNNIVSSEILGKICELRATLLKQIDHTQSEE